MHRPEEVLNIQSELIFVTGMYTDLSFKWGDDLRLFTQFVLVYIPTLSHQPNDVNDGSLFINYKRQHTEACTYACHIYWSTRTLQSCSGGWNTCYLHVYRFCVKCRKIIFIYRLRCHQTAVMSFYSLANPIFKNFKFTTAWN